MPLNPNIILGVQRPKFTSPQELYAQKAQFEQNELANRLGNMKMQEYERGVQESNAQKEAVRGFGNDTTANYNRLLQTGNLKAAQDYAEGNAKTARERAIGDKAKIETTQKVLGLMGSTAYALSQSPTLNIQEVVGAVEQLKAQLPPEYHAALDVSKLPQDPQGLRTALQGIYTKSIETEKLLSDATSRRNNDQTNATSRANNSASVGVQRDRLNFDKEKDKRDGSAGGKAPAGYRFKPDGSLEPIPGGPAAGKAATATEGERKAATLLKRLEGSQAQLNTALKENPDAAKPGVIASGMRAVGAEALANTTAVGSERQRIEAAQLDMLDAALTLGTGAAYTREQLEGYRKSYFPQIGDTDDNVRDKKARLKNVIDAAKIAAGRAGPGGGSSGVTGGWDGGDDPLGLRK